MAKVLFALAAFLAAVLAEPPVDTSYLPPGRQAPSSQYGAPSANGFGASNGYRNGASSSYLPPSNSLDDSFGSRKNGRNGYPSNTYGAPAGGEQGFNDFGSDSVTIDSARIGGGSSYSRQPSGTYGAPNRAGQAIGAPSRSYGAPQNGFGPSSFGGPSAFYGAPSAARSGPPSGTYGGPTQFGQPSSSYGAPSRSGSSFGSPSSSYGAPSRSGSSFGAPSSSYGAPSRSGSSFGAPSSSYGAPSRSGSSFGAPSGSYGAPGRSGQQVSSRYGAPARSSFGNGFGSRPSSTYGAPGNQGAAGKYTAAIPSNTYGTPFNSAADNFGTAPSSTYGAPSNALDTGYSRSGPSSEYGAPGNGNGNGYGYGKKTTTEDPLAEPANYEYTYEVRDEETNSGAEFGHQESREDESARGVYHVLLPDGRMQIVEYEADEEGYRPQIRYEETGYPDARSGQNGQGGY